MEVKLHPSVIREIERGELHRNWPAMAKRVNEAAPAWQLVLTMPEGSNAPGIVDVARERLRANGCRARVVALRGLGINQRPWVGWAVFAKVPR